MLKFSKITKAAMAIIGMAAVAAASMSGAAVAKNDQVREHEAYTFHYQYEHTGPIESRRAEYVALRDLRDSLPKGSVQWSRADASLKEIPTEVKWVDEHRNLVTTAGKNDLLTQYFKGSTYTAAWYMLLVDNASFTAYAAGDTMASHTGWIESVAYAAATRPAITFGTASAGSLVSTAVAFAINATATINGAGVVTNSTKSGTTGVGYSFGAFTGGNRAVTNGDTLNVTLTVSA